MKELIIVGGIMVLLALAIHPDLLSDPLGRFNLMQERGNYFHPFLYTVLIYTISGVVRLSLIFLKRLFSSSPKNTLL